uniref:F-box domain-containing protein n=1 Tax=Setaria viridis TaxID=4556 RepID=A0A4V6DAQ6_SETVI|nr:hypothetical protein SEVIR_2G076300v2 [Setaria viridis]
MGPVLRRRKKTALALDNDGVLPADVLYEVLLRLPADELCRLRLVCRSWRSLTSDPGFARAHASRHPLLAGVHIACRTDDEIRVVDLFSGDIVRRIVPTVHPRYGMNSQLDLVCVSGRRTHEPSSVLNLATGEVVATFHPKSHWINKDMMSPFLLGHIPSTGELKVFYTHWCGEGGGHGGLVQTCCIKTLIGDGGSRRWRVTSSPLAVLGSDLRDRVVIGGVAYILFSQNFNETNDHNEDLEPDDMAVFDMAAEEWRPAPLRGPLSSCLAGDDERCVHHQHRHEILLAMVDDCLVTVHNNDCYQYCSMDLWFLVDMDVDKGLWTKRFSIHCTTLCKGYKCHSPYPLLLLDDGRIVIWEDVIKVLRVYDPRTSKWDDITTLNNYFSVNMYRGNLLCPGLQR